SIRDEQLELEAMFFLTRVRSPDADDLSRTLALADEAIARARLGNPWRLAELYQSTALLARWAGDRERAGALTADARALGDDLGTERVSIETRLMAPIAPSEPTPAAAPVALAEIVPRAEAFGDKRVLSWLYPTVASQCLAARRVGDAARWYRATMELA